MRCAILGSRFWVLKSWSNLIQGHSEVLDSEARPASLVIWQGSLLIHIWSCAEVLACLERPVPLCGRKRCAFGVPRPISEPLSRLKQPNGHQTTSYSAGSCIGRRLKLCKSTSGGRGRCASAQGHISVFRRRPEKHAGGLMMRRIAPERRQSRRGTYVWVCWMARRRRSKRKWSTRLEILREVLKSHQRSYLFSFILRIGRALWCASEHINFLGTFS